MLKERNVKDIVLEYKVASSTLSGFEHTQSLHEEFVALENLEKQLFEDKKILEEPFMLLNLNLKISEGEGSVEGTVMGVEIDAQGHLMAILLKGQPKPISFTENTVISPTRA